jgi:phosphoribosylformimino-5-aminoimidazole carboxamide ribotide isomerase
VAAALSAFDGVDIAAVIVTAIERDGMLTGPDREGLAHVLETTSLPVIASGGVGSVADIAALAELSVALGPGPDRVRSLAGVITGKALVDGRLTVEEGMAACRPSG